MKKTYNINLNGQLFCIDEDAYSQLQHYITKLENHYLHEEDGQEILSDIESRIAELFTGFLQKSHRAIITQAEIEKVIEVMGTPEVIIEDDAEPASSAHTTRKKLYRDNEHMVLGGVASGLAAYFGIPLIWVRLAFIVLSFFFGITIILYLILWIITPEAVTSKQKLEMQGEKINVSNIEKNIRRTYAQVRKNTKLPIPGTQLRSKLNSFFTRLWQTTQKAISFLVHVIAIIALILSAFAFLSACWGIFFTFHLLPENYLLFFKYFCHPVPLWVIKFFLFCLINLPLILIIYYSILYLFKYKSHKGFLLTSGILWLISCFAIIFLSIFYTTNNANNYETSAEIPLSPATPDKQLLNIQFAPSFPYTEGRFSPFGLDNYLYNPSGTDSTVLYIQPSIRFEKTTQSEPQLILAKQARGFSGIDATNNIDNIRYNYQWKNDTLFLDNYFTLDKPKWRINQLEIVILIPEKYQVILENIPWQNVYSYHIFTQTRQTMEKLKRQQLQMQQGKLTLVSK